MTAIVQDLHHSPPLESLEPVSGPCRSGRSSSCSANSCASSRVVNSLPKIKSSIGNEKGLGMLGFQRFPNQTKHVKPQAVPMRIKEQNSQKLEWNGNKEQFYNRFPSGYHTMSSVA